MVTRQRPQQREVFDDLDFEELDHETIRTAIVVLEEMGRGDLAKRLREALERAERESSISASA